MCFGSAAVAAANLQDNLHIQPLIKEPGYAWVTSSKVPGGCGNGPASKCGLSRGSGPLCHKGRTFVCPICCIFLIQAKKGPRALTVHVTKRGHTNVICNKLVSHQHQLGTTGARPGCSEAVGP